jgi:hypothetical protein
MFILPLLQPGSLKLKEGVLYTTNYGTVKHALVTTSMKE